MLEYELVSYLKKQGKLPEGGSILELGEANWYGDVNLQRLRDDIGLYASEEQRRELLDVIDLTATRADSFHMFDLAKAFYRTFFNYQQIDAIDFHGTERAMKLDLNEPVKLEQQYDFIMNDGTGEHVFNVFQFFKTVHEVTLPGGVMFHGMPFSGWVDHGFFNFNPTFYWDLAAANGYEILLFAYAELTPPKICIFNFREEVLEFAKQDKIGKNSLLYLAARKPVTENPFRVPMQGYYAGAISPSAQQDWAALR
jgi:hypothetical protein